jgi:general secretion pathway protein G
MVRPVPEMETTPTTYSGPIPPLAEIPARDINRRKIRRDILLVILVVSALFIAIMIHLSHAVMKQLQVAKRKTAAAQIANFVSALNMYHKDNSYYPTSEQSLEALVQKPTAKPVPANFPRDGYICAPPRDPWNNDYVYTSPALDGGPYSIMSYGADGKPGGEGENADIESGTLQGLKTGAK